MANITAKTSSNVFYQARCNAATHNEQLSSREGAADYMGAALQNRKWYCSTVSGRNKADGGFV